MRIALVALSIGAFAACGSSSKSTVTPSASCAHSMQAYHDALVRSGDNLTDTQEGALQHGTITACTRAEWLVAVKPYDSGDYHPPLGDLVIGNTKPEDVLAAFCADLSTAKACS